SELMLVWCMMIVACAVPASGLMRYSFSIPASPAYYAARTEFLYEDYVLKEVPGDLVLTKDPKSVAARNFFEGTPGGEKVRIPWGPWLRPMVAWGVFAILFYMATFCIGGILRKQWVESERLIFPVARVPLELTEDAGGSNLLPALVCNKGFVIGVIITLAFALIRSAPVMMGAEQGWRPELPVQAILAETPLQYMRMGTGYVYPIAIGFAFLVPSDISLGIWFFFIFASLEMQMSQWIGQPLAWGPGTTFLAWQEAGAYVVFVIMMLWAARRHLAAVFRKAVGVGRSVDDSNEPISYRFGFWGFVVSFLGMALWLTYYKVNFLVALALLALMFVIVLGLARLVAQGGLFFVQQQWQPPGVLHSISGGRAFGAAACVVVQMQNAIFISDAREILSGHAMNALRVASVFEKHRRMFLPAMFAALLLALGVCGWATLHTYYRIGGYNIANSYGTKGLPIYTFNTAHRMITVPAQSAEPHYGPMLLGAGIMFFVTFMRSRFYWWPVHSLGFMLAASYAARTLWLSFLLGWLAKVTTLKFAGGSIFKVLRSFFLGVIIAESFVIAVSTMLGLFGVKLGYIFLPP
ncbi:MAG: hypothetical protein KAX44_04905, partial [Candidatus Brocadiae bacterium]|nr:hypothetical protein [Candidatus Brocadiia bacterium]